VSATETAAPSAKHRNEPVVLSHQAHGIDRQHARYTPSVSQLGRALIVLGLLLAVVGVAMVLGSKLGLGRLPGDIVVEKKGFRFQFPIVTSIVVSVVLSLLLNLLLRRR
jgi:uncharacterized membrane protein